MKKIKDEVIKDKQENIAIKRAKHKLHKIVKLKRLLGSINSKNGNITVFFTDIQGEITTKIFPSKGLLKNQEFKTCTLNKNIIDIKFKRKLDDKKKEKITSQLANKTQKESPKYEKLKIKRNKKYEERATIYTKLANKALEHTKTKGKTITKIQPLVEKEEIVLDVNKTQNNTLIKKLTEPFNVINTTKKTKPFNVCNTTTQLKEKNELKTQNMDKAAA